LGLVHAILANPLHSAVEKSHVEPRQGFKASGQAEENILVSDVINALLAGDREMQRKQLNGLLGQHGAEEVISQQQNQQEAKVEPRFEYFPMVEGAKRKFVPKPIFIDDVEIAQEDNFDGPQGDEQRKFTNITIPTVFPDNKLLEVTGNCPIIPVKKPSECAKVQGDRLARFKEFVQIGENLTHTPFFL